MSVDCQQLMNVVISFHQFWSLPVQVAGTGTLGLYAVSSLRALAVALYLLYRQVGTALLAGLGVVLFLIPVNAYLTKVIAKVTR